MGARGSGPLLLSSVSAKVSLTLFIKSIFNRVYVEEMAKVVVR